MSDYCLAINTVCSRVIALRAENERLRGALENLAQDRGVNLSNEDDQIECDYCHLLTKPYKWPTSFGGLFAPIDHMEWCPTVLARAALTGEE